MSPQPTDLLIFGIRDGGERMEKCLEFFVTVLAASTHMYMNMPDNMYVYACDHVFI